MEGGQLSQGPLQGENFHCGPSNQSGKLFTGLSQQALAILTPASALLTTACTLQGSITAPSCSSIPGVFFTGLSQQAPVSLTSASALLTTACTPKVALSRNC